VRSQTFLSDFIALLSICPIAMDDMNACAECGYTTNNFMEFLKHIDEHEKEKIIVVDDDDIKDSHGDDGQNGVSRFFCKK
jgi:hypothetical protein